MAENKTEAELKAEADAKAEADKKAADEREDESPEDKTKREAAEALEKERQDELARERARAKKAEDVAADLAFKLRDKKRKEKDEKADDEDEDDDDEDDKPVTKRDMQAMLDRNTQKTRKEMQATIIAETVKKIADSPTEAELIIEIHKNRTFPEGMPLEEQLEEAQAIANRKRTAQQNAELKRALQGKENASDDAAGTHRDGAPSATPHMNSVDSRAILAAGYVWDGKTKLFIKQLNGGKKILTYDPKSKKRAVVAK